MIKISQQEFEEKVQDVIDGKTTRTQLQIDLRVDKNTLNNKIQELVVYKPELYRAFVQKFPYRPREYSHIDYEALIIDIMKKGYTRREWDEVYGISSRTIIRKIYCIEDENPELINLYREVAKYRKEQKTLPLQLKLKVDMLESREIFCGGIYDKKREELLAQEKEYIEKLQQGKGATQASREIGRERMSKAINTLNRIEIETRTREEIKIAGFFFFS